MCFCGIVSRALVWQLELQPLLGHYGEKTGKYYILNDNVRTTRLQGQISCKMFSRLCDAFSLNKGSEKVMEYSSFMLEDMRATVTHALIQSAPFLNSLYTIQATQRLLTSN